MAFFRRSAAAFLFSRFLSFFASNCQCCSIKKRHFELPDGVVVRSKVLLDLSRKVPQFQYS